MFLVKRCDSEKDLKGIIDLRYEILRAPWQQSYESATDELESTSINAFIADSNGEVIGCGRLQENANKIGQVRYMAVRKGYQGRGLGKKILNFLEDEARKLNLKTIELQARENALRFYEHEGYTQKEKSFLLWGIIQHYLMTKKL